jgi:hypothetical protein
VVDSSVLAALDVNAVLTDVPHGEIARAKTVATLPPKGVDREVVGRQVEDRDAVRVDDDAVPPSVLAVEDDGVAVYAPDRDVVLVARNDVPARVRPAVDEDRVARFRARDRLLDRRDVLRDPDRRVRRVIARKRERRDGEDDESRDPTGAYALASSSSFFVSVITFCAMCAGTSS